MRKKQNHVGYFEIVDFDPFFDDWVAAFPPSEDASGTSVFNTVSDIYDMLKKPTRATSGSAGYDFYSPISISLKPGESLRFPTGIRAVITNPSYALFIMPRSSLGFKYRLQLDNTIGLIDSDFQYADNMGDISLKMTNCGDKQINIEAGDRIAQGVFIQYGIVDDDTPLKSERNGGIGSTGV